MPADLSPERGQGDADAEGRLCDPTRRLHPADGSLGCRAPAHDRTWTATDRA
jgi:hypothetical protein